MKFHDTSKSIALKQKERHIVTWTQQEDDILREQIGIHGTENWAIIAAQFKDKTTRQCRRRWYTYLNSDFKKGGWSHEEDMILCEAQKMYGNRWTEIAKVVSGRTDNAVKNRFSTLCKKRAKNEALSKENSKLSYINQNSKRTIIENAFVTNGTSDAAPPLKKMRTHILEMTENCDLKGRLHIKSGTVENHSLRPPFTVLVENSPNLNDLPAQLNCQSTSMISTSDNGNAHISNLDFDSYIFSTTYSKRKTNTTNPFKLQGNNKTQGTFIRRDDPRITSLMQQADLLSSLAIKVNTEKNNQSLENAWKELQNFLKRNSENELLTSESDFPLEDLLNYIEESSHMESLPCWRQPNPYESPGSSGCSTGSNLQSHTANDTIEKPHAENCALEQDASVAHQSVLFEENGGGGCEAAYVGSSVSCVGPQSFHTVENGGGWLDGFHTGESVAQVEDMPFCEEYKENDIISALSNTEFPSPVQSTPKGLSNRSQTWMSGARKKLLGENTSGIPNPEPKPQPFPTTSLQKGPAAQPLSINSYYYSQNLFSKSSSSSLLAT
ncbi:hypothetical protein IFM89_022383 [Coptis chinensis]|uniref:Uncharacterized protein n=1 Tax=Coptis chinensis TaxID=261450 RepID=A0A835IXV5_9MAGN|nr:hypothetical protein IFM89_022383 [Coptis chinensis]